MKECGRYLGCFLPPSVFLPLVLPRLGAGYHGERPLIVLGALIEGSTTALLQPCLPELVSALAEEDVAFVFEEAHQEALLCVIRTLLGKCDFSENSFKVFNLLLFIASSSTSENASVAQEGLKELSRNCGYEDVQDLYHKHTREVLDRLLEAVGGWTEGSPSFLLLGGLMKLAGESSCRHHKKKTGLLPM